MFRVWPNTEDSPDCQLYHEVLVNQDFINLLVKEKMLT